MNMPSSMPPKIKNLATENDKSIRILTIILRLSLIFLWLLPWIGHPGMKRGLQRVNQYGDDLGYFPSREVAFIELPISNAVHDNVTNHGFDLLPRRFL